MNEPGNQNPKPPKRSKRKPAMEPLGWDEIVSQPGMGGYLSFLNGPVPLPHLQGSAAGVAPAPVVESDPVSTSVSIPVVDIPSVVESTAEPELPTVTAPAPVAAPQVIPVVDVSPEVEPTPGLDQTPEETVEAIPGVISFPGVLPGQRVRIRKCAATHDGHSLGEEVLYQSLWKAAAPESDATRTITVGWRGMSQLCRMTPKNCKINTQRLIRKLALEVLSPYNTPESIGTTYRVYSDAAILERRRAAGLEWVVRSRGVEFVDPASGQAVTAQLCSYASK